MVLKYFIAQRKNNLHDDNHPRNLNISWKYSTSTSTVATVYVFCCAYVNHSSLNGDSADSQPRIQCLMPEPLKQNVNALVKCTDSKTSQLITSFILTGIN